MFPFSTSSVSRPAPYSAELAQRSPRDTGDEDDRESYIPPREFHLLNRRDAYRFARDVLGTWEKPVGAAQAWAFAKVAAGGRKTREGWRAVLCAPSAFRMVRRAG